jgi:SAM-dependent methyltransferase
MAFSDLRAFVRANLPEPPARVLEVGAGAGRLARALHAVGYDVLAIDPESESDDVRAVALADLDEPAGSFAAAVAIVSLHHIDPLEDSCRRLGEVVEPAGTLLVDEFDVSAFDTAAASWWLEQRRALGDPQPETAEELVAEHREHLHPLEQSSRHSSRTSSSDRRCAAPGCTAGTSASRCAQSRKRQSPVATCARPARASSAAGAAD